MKPIYEAKTIQIEITNYCNLRCINCSRFCGHYQNPYFMDLVQVENALQSLEGFKYMVGCMGGEPTLHPQFEEICKLFQKYLPRDQRGLWTNGARWNQYEQLIRETFPLENIVFNAHDYEYKGQHQPILIASKEVIKDERLRQELIDKCWVQERWSPSINPHGAYFCEIAAAMGMLLNIKGWDVRKDWWRKKPKAFYDQVNQFCSRCSMCIPFESSVYKNPKQLITSWNLLQLYYNKCKGIDRFEIYSKEYTRDDYKKNIKEWKPGQFRDFEQHEKGVRLYK